MISGDFLMRQVHQLAQVLARILARRQTEDTHQLLEELRSAWRQDPLLESPLELSRSELIAACSHGGRLHAEKALLVADLLALEGELLAEQGQVEPATRARQRALWIYEAATRDQDAAVPFDLPERMARLRDQVTAGS